MKYFRKNIVLIFSVFCLINTGNAEESRAIEKRFSTTPSQLIDIRDFQGSGLKISSWDKNEIYIKLNIKIESSDEDFEKRAANEVNVQDSISTSSLVLSFKKPKATWTKSFWNIFKSFFNAPNVKYSISGEIVVPQANSLSINVRYSSLAMDNVVGDINILGTSNQIKLKECSSIRKIENKYGSTEIEKCGGNFNLFSYSGKISIDGFDGEGTIEADYSTILVRNVKKSLSIRSKTRDKMVLEDINGDLSIKGYLAPIDIKKVRGNVDLTLEHSSVMAEDISGDWNSETEYSKMILRDLTSKKIVMSNRNDDIEIEMKSIPKVIKIRNNHGSVDVSVPLGATGDISLETDNGKIDCNLPITLKSSGSGFYGTGKIGSGGGSITIETKFSGDIKLIQR